MKEGRHIKPAVVTHPVVLEVHGLCFRYPQRELFADWSAHIPPGVTLLRGGDGRGKTTLLRLLAGDLPADAGQLQIKGIALAEQLAAYRQHLFWTDPRSDAFDAVTALDYFSQQAGGYPLFDRQALNDMVQGLALAPHIDKPLYMLSSGSKRKVWLAAAFASGAALTLLDEPFAALDKPSIGFVIERLRDASKHTQRAWVLAHYEAPAGLPLAATLDLGD